MRNFIDTTEAVYDTQQRQIDELDKKWSQTCKALAETEQMRVDSEAQLTEARELLDEAREALEKIEQIKWGYDGDCGALAIIEQALANTDKTTVRVTCPIHNEQHTITLEGTEPRTMPCCANTDKGK